ncbi:putative nuclease HARBI1 [Ischnura elegans]|uniref:putative nuclease HARBI1 n=1 Tax=Ischnura elegans TaxID=197161 RepID=UPI001ED8A775|nr:putative nuclease HARBI1 [Ischnura elegans]
MFDMLCRELAPFIGRQDTVMRPALPVAKRVAVALFYLKSGADYGVVGLAFGVGKATVHVIVRDFCRAVLDRYFMECIVFPSTEEGMAAKENCFRTQWNFPGTIGAIDGCHIPMKTPIHGGADYYNYKGWHSVILLAVVDSQYRFIYCNSGYPGRVHDAGVLRASALWDVITNGGLPGKYHLIGDGAFPLGANMVKPFPRPNGPHEEHFNYRLSRARMVVENAFGRLKGRWRVLLKASEVDVARLVEVINTCCILHNICEENREVFWADWLEEANAAENMFPQPQDEAGGDNFVDGEEKREFLAQQLYDAVQ